MGGTLFRKAERSEHVPVSALTGFAEAVLVALGAGPHTAPTVARSLVESDVQGHSSHGVRRLLPYAGQIERGELDPRAEPSVLDGTPPAVVHVDGRRGFGHLTAALGARTLLDRVPGIGIAAAVLERCNHVGRLGEYVATLADAGLVGIAFANADPTVAPWGGRERLLGTNPTAWALPSAPGTAPVVIDFATSATAEGKLSVARAAGRAVPPGLLIDAAGRDSTDPDDFYGGGALLPLGGHKGYGLAVAFDLVAGVLSRTGSASAPGYDNSFGTVLIALDVRAFVPLDEFTAQVEALRERLHAATARPGFSGVLMPGEPEWSSRRRRIDEGVPLDERTREELDGLADRLGVPRLPALGARPPERT